VPGEPTARLRADVQPEPPLGELAVGSLARLGVLGELRCGDHVHGQLDRERERVLVADLLCHLAADEYRVRAGAEVLEDAELVVDLGAAGDQDERTPDVAEQLPEVLELLLEEQPRVGRQERRHPDRRGVRAVHRAERVLDEEGAPAGGLFLSAGGSAAPPKSKGTSSRRSI